MGRPLFSKKYAKKPAGRTETERVVDPLCQKWSATNNFDPDSDDFFVNAQEERVLGPDELQANPPGGIEAVSTHTGFQGSAESMESSGGEVAGPITTGADTLNAVMRHIYPATPPELWEQHLPRLSAEASEWLTSAPAPTPGQSVGAPGAFTDSSREGLEGDAATTPYRSNRPRSASAAPALVPLAALLSQSRPADASVFSPPLQQSPLAPTPNVVDDANLRISPEDRPSSVQAVLPSSPLMTPQRNTVRGATQTILTPSPPPSVTPRYYSWQTHAIPAIPTRTRGPRDGPLTNPLARRSFIRIGTAQAPVLVTNTAN